MPRYVILEHDWPKRHWDFMLEAGDVLKTWKLLAPPQCGQVMDIEASFDHRLLYLDYEGPIGGGRGSVVRIDSGTFDWLVDETQRVLIALNQGRLSGVAEFVWCHDDKWQLNLTRVKNATISGSNHL